MVIIYITCFLFFTFCMERVHPTICHIGYGQRGLRYSNQITWERNCYETDYCYEAVTDDIEKVRRLIDFPWDPYYYQFFVKSCGGDHGMPAKDYHPWQDLAEFGAVEGLLGSLTVNLTFPMTITGHGGVENFDLRYTCRKDLCSGGMRSHTINLFVALLAIATLTFTLNS